MTLRRHQIDLAYTDGRHSEIGHLITDSEVIMYGSRRDSRCGRGVCDVEAEGLTDFEIECITYAINEGNEYSGDVQDDNGNAIVEWRVENEDTLLADLAQD